MLITDGDRQKYPGFNGTGGLTKREYFAAIAMQSLISMQTENWCANAEDIGAEAVRHADALIDALNYR